MMNILKNQIHNNCNRRYLIQIKLKSQLSILLCSLLIISNPKYTDNNTVSISEKTKAEEKTVETVSLIKDPNNSNNCCFFCHGTDDIVKCYGGCDRYFHLRCLGAKRKKDMKKWKCRECSGGELKSSTFHKKHCLRSWYFKDVVELVDGSHSVIIEGTLCYDESTWKCSPIDHLIDKTHIVTINHSIYTLIVCFHSMNYL